jgi:putative restriction endonuclease
METTHVTSIDEAVDRLYNLNVGVLGKGATRHERPHKPLMLLAVLDLIADGHATPERIPWCPVLREKFGLYFNAVRQRDDKNSPENPFFYLHSDGFWSALRCADGPVRALDGPPTVADAKRGEVFARIFAGFEHFVVTPMARTRIRDALISRYFPSARVSIESVCSEPANNREDTIEGSIIAAREKEEAFGRSPAFRRKILEIYDWQCAACGLRIKLPDSQHTIVDAAHLVPFSESRNDHPSNGLALCKNHHWAMDRHLIAPTIRGVWRASSRLERRRSRAEEQLLDLDGQELLPPTDDAFRPAPESLRWRADRLA